MPHSAFLASRRLRKAPTLMLPSKQVDGECYLFVGQKIPSHTMQHISMNADDANSLPTQPRRLPGQAMASPCQHGMKANEQQQFLRNQWSHFDYRLKRYVRGMLRLYRVDDVGIAAGNCAHLDSVGAGKYAGGHGWIGKPEGAGCKKRPAARGVHHQLQRPASQGILFSCDLPRVRELSRGSDQRRRFQNLDAPAMREFLRVFG